MGTKCAPLIADLFLSCYCSQFMTNVHKDGSKSDLKHKFHNSYRYLGNILAVNNPDFFKHTAERIDVK